LQQALAQCAEWRAAGLDLPVAVNLSARSVHDPSLIPTIRQALTRWNLPAHRLEIELTESALMADPDRGAEMLRQLHAMGVHIAIDDFGTGYSSLTHLQRLPVDELKIDKSFVQNMASNEGDVFIVRSVADLGHSLGLTIVAEGVEDDRSLRLLSVMGCDLVQGYHVSRPLPARDLRSWMQRARSSLAT
jgi:EAL domain-containing protein (putative c-di-GMP-specific phosphodiesterase class I)